MLALFPKYLLIHFSLVNIVQAFLSLIIKKRAYPIANIAKLQFSFLLRVLNRTNSVENTKKTENAAVYRALHDSHQFLFGCIGQGVVPFRKLYNRRCRFTTRRMFQVLSHRSNAGIVNSNLKCMDEIFRSHVLGLLSDPH